MYDLFVVNIFFIAFQLFCRYSHYLNTPSPNIAPWTDLLWHNTWLLSPSPQTLHKFFGAAWGSCKGLPPGHCVEKYHSNFSFHFFSLIPGALLWDHKIHGLDAPDHYLSPFLSYVIWGIISGEMASFVCCFILKFLKI